MKLSKTMGIFLILMLLGLSLMGCTVLSQGDNVLISRDEYEQLNSIATRFSKLLELEQQIKHNFYQDASEVDFDSAIIKGMFNALNDPYSTYFTPEEYADFNQSLSGEYVGIGTYVSQREDGLIEVVSPIKGSPADYAGILPGDIIWKVDDLEIQTMELTQAVDLMRGEVGAPVTIHIRRDNENLSFDLVRAKITVPSVESEVRASDIGYIKINSFEEKTAADFKASLNQLLDQAVSGLIIDLRNNGGGYLSSVVEIADRILGKTVIVSTVAPDGMATEYSSDEMSKIDLPLVILVNKGSASASEILAGAVQDTESGKIIGETTFGKGIVQSTFDLKDGSGFRLTTSYYLTPNGHNIDKKGIDPDIDHEMIEAAGYELADRYRIGDEDDKVLDYALDYLQGKVK